MNSEYFWKVFAYGFFITNSICILILLDMLIFGKPIATLFLVIFGLTLYYNLKLFKKI